MAPKYDIFISYRRAGGFETAKHLYDLLVRDGYTVSFDVDTLRNGDFDAALLDRISHCKDFILILDEHVFDRTLDASYPKDKDWLRNELAYALAHDVNIIPIMLTGFTGFPEGLPGDIAGVVMKNGPHYNKDYFDAFYARLTEFLTSKPRTSHISVSGHGSLYRTIGVVLISIVALFLCAAMLFLLLHLFKQKQTVFKYDNNNLSVKVAGLTDIQRVALKELLDQMVFVQEGDFLMGTGRDTLLTRMDSTSRPVHKVALSSYYISSREVTQAQWMAFSQPSDAIEQPGLDYPVDYLSWNQAKSFADTLSAITGLHFSLPTEAQWEYAAKGGPHSCDFIYSGSDSHRNVGWLKTSPNTCIHSVAKLAPNDLELFDMTGNVDEWCLDYFAPYESRFRTNPSGPSTGSTRVFRGGNVNTLPFDAKVSVRHHYMPDFHRSGTGMRLVINLEQ